MKRQGVEFWLNDQLISTTSTEVDPGQFVDNVRDAFEEYVKNAETEFYTKVTDGVIAIKAYSEIPPIVAELERLFRIAGGQSPSTDT